MKIIEKLSNKIEKEIECAEEYIKCALETKEDQPMVSETFYKIANEKMGHMTLLHTQVVALIDEYKKTNGEAPKEMKILYDILHKKHIEHAAAVKGMIALYKEIWGGINYVTGL